jgi:hypothetical protein
MQNQHGVATADRFRFSFEASGTSRLATPGLAITKHFDEEHQGGQL